MKPEYIEYIKNEIGLLITNPSLSSNTHQEIECLLCDNTFIATPKSKVSNFRNTNALGCPKCTLKQRTSNSTKNNIIKLKERFDFIIPNDWNNSLQLNVTNKECGHTFISKISNLLYRNVICPVCNNKRKRKRCTKFNKLKYENSLIYKKDFQYYKAIVDNLTKKNYRIHKNTINPNNYPRVLAKNGNKGYHLDHIASKYFCFMNNIPPEMCADPRNLQMIDWYENISKHSNVDNGQIPTFIKEFLTNE